MEQIRKAKGITLDKFGELFLITRKRYKVIPLLFGWKLVKEETDEKYRMRMYQQITSWRNSWR
ncbi:hypothetical protein [Caloranaerobacter azorensis]|uniref:Uncharacterized protein n=1 Tax=Caloranaerobacter azorensis TaxID=116090 RepID=A0A6P1YB20_9FIRM|nr:hypothetical protein [Caloranaerobacter azorensis]QIB26082.1 hypothetical protein G3A45_01410 [Caloranaerobacter azorensis]